MEVPNLFEELSDTESVISPLEDMAKPFCCEQCPKSYHSVKHLRLHSKAAHCPFPLRCEDCDMYFPNKGYLLAHINSVHRIIECLKCESKFETSATLEKHIARSHKSHDKNVSDDSNQNEENMDQTVPEMDIDQRSVTVDEYKCPKCDKGFSFEESLELHVGECLPGTTAKTGVSPDVFQCDKCKEEFATQDDLVIHMTSAHMKLQITKLNVPEMALHDQGASSDDDKPEEDVDEASSENEQSAAKGLKCAICKIFLKNKVEWKIHARKFHLTKGGRFKCNHCDKTFVKPTGVRKHVEKEHEFTSQVKCDHCNKVLKSKESLMRHVRDIHVGKGRFRCYKCNLCFTTQFLLKRHDEIVHRGLKGQWCDLCQKELKANLKSHIDRVHLGIAKKYCKHCDKNIKGHLKRHIERVHLNIASFKCSECDKCYKSKTDLKHHLLRVHRGVDTSKECPMCHKRYTKCHLKRHIETVHMGVAKYKCDQCEKAYKNKRGLTMHFKDVHLQLVHRKDCKHCGRQIKETNMRRHIAILHEGDKRGRLKCEKCTLCFVTSLRLQRHDEIVHRGLKGRWCDQCQKEVKGYFQRHVEAVHLGIAKFKCNKCAKAYRRPGSLKRHVQTDHDIKRKRTVPSAEDAKYKCKYCDKTFTHSKDFTSHLAREHC